MSFWSKFEEFFAKWFCGPRGDPNVYREHAYTIGAAESEKPKFSRNNVVDWLSATTKIKELKRENHYLSILIYDPEARPVGYRYLYYDFDCEEDPERARREAMEFVKNVADRYGAVPVVYFSGRKGYGVLVVIDQTIDFETYRRVWNILRAPLTLSTLDPKVLDARRVHRIPYTYNVKPDHVGMCYLVDPRTFKKIRMEDFDWENYEPLKLGQIKDLIAPIAGFSVPKPRTFRVGGGRSSRKLVSLPEDPAELDKCEVAPPCIRNIVQALKAGGELDHYQRLALVWYLKWVGYSKEKVIDLFRRFATDFNEKVTTYQVEYAYGERGKREDWLAPSCRWMKEHGLCVECGWNRNIATYTYARALVPEELKQRFFELVRKRSIGI